MQNQCPDANTGIKVNHCDHGWDDVIFLTKGMLCPFGSRVSNNSSPDPQYHIYSWQLASFILPVQICYHLKNKQTRKQSQNQPTNKTNKIQTTLNVNGENKGVQSVGAWHDGPFPSLGEQVIPLCMQRLADRLALLALIATAFAFPPSAADLLQCFFIR